MDFPELLAEAMERLEISSVDQLAEYLGLTQGAVSKWMRRIQSPKKDSWVDLAKKLGVTVGDIGAAVGNTVIVKKPTLAAQLRACEDRLAGALAEIEHLRSRLPGGR